jgi:hypothetical protein
VRWPFRRLRAGFEPTSGPYGELRRGCFVPRKSAAQRLSTHNVSQPIHPLTPRALDGCLYPRPPARTAPAAVTYATQFCHDLILLLLGNKSRLLLLLTWADSRSVRNHPFRDALASAMPHAGQVSGIPHPAPPAAKFRHAPASAGSPGSAQAGLRARPQAIAVQPHGSHPGCGPALRAIALRPVAGVAML